MFVNRINEVRILNITAEAILAHEQRNIAIIGNRRIGKTELILEFKRKWQKKQGIVFPYLNVQRVGSIDSFVFSYYREFLFEIGKKQGMMMKRIDLVTWDDLLILSTKLHLERFTEKLKGLEGMGGLEFLFESQEEILEKTGLVSIFLFDEFQYVERFGIRFLEVMRGVIEKQNMIAYVITGSSISLMEKIFSQSKEPFFAQFRRMYLGPLQKLDAKKLAAAVLRQHGLNFDDTSGNEIFRLTNGHPFYVISLCRRIVEQFDTVNVEKIRYAFLEETLSPRGDIYLVLDYIFNESLSRAYKGELHRQILLILAGKQGLTLTEVAHELGRPSGEVSNYLKLLLKTDILVREENQYYFQDSLLAFWLKNTYLGIDDAELENAIARNNLLAELTEKYLRVSSELGRAKEYEYKALLEEEFTIPLNRFVGSDGQVEFDLVGEKNGIVYIFEIKWRNRPVSIKEIVNFGSKIQQSDFATRRKKVFIISKSGFDAKALEMAKKQKIHCLDKDMKERRK